MRNFLRVLGISLVAMIIAAGHAQAVMKTLPFVPILDQGWMGTTTGYRYSCGPLSATAIMAYWALHGFPDLMSAAPTSQVPEKSPQIVNLFRNMVTYTTYDDYDFELTVAEPKLASELSSFLESKGYSGTVELAGWGHVTFERIRNEIDAGRPVMLLVVGWNHWMVVKGYDDYTRQLEVLWGHPDGNHIFERTISFASIRATDADPATGTNAVYIRLDKSMDNGAAIY
jgi:hypothetical protein